MDTRAHNQSKSLNDLPDGYLWHQCVEVLKETEKRVDNLEAKESGMINTYTAQEVRTLRKLVQAEMIEDGKAEGMTLTVHSLNRDTIEMRVQTYILAGVKPGL